MQPLRMARRFVMRSALLLLLVIVAPAVHAQSPAVRLGQVLMLPEVADLLREEGLRYGASLDDDLLEGRGGTGFTDRVGQIYDSAAMISVMETHLVSGLSDDAAQASLDFFDTPLGQRILRLELSARRALADPVMDAAATESFIVAAEAGDPRVDTILDFIAITDLNDRNVTEALGSNYRFLLGLSETTGKGLSEAEIIDQVWSQEEEIRATTSEWLQSFLFMAYGPLSNAELLSYIEFCDTEAGRALNRALFDSYEEMFGAIYYALGLTVGRAMQSTDL